MPWVTSTTAYQERNCSNFRLFNTTNLGKLLTSEEAVMSELGISSLCKPSGELQSETANYVLLKSTEQKN